jgi:hypothetical protein
MVSGSMSASRARMRKSVCPSIVTTSKAKGDSGSTSKPNF